MDKSKRRTILRELGKLYPDAQSELDFTSEYQLVVSVILSAQCTDKKVNEVTPQLFAQFPDFGALSKARVTSIEKIIRPVNYYRTKAANLKAMATMVRENFKGALPRSHEQMMELPGVGRKTANVVLGEMGVCHTLAVDTHVKRLANRLGLADSDKPDVVEEQITKQYPSSEWRQLHHCLILHGRRVCKAGRPLCEECPLNKICPSSLVRD